MTTIPRGGEDHVDASNLEVREECRGQAADEIVDRGALSNRSVRVRHLPVVVYGDDRVHHVGEEGCEVWRVRRHFGKRHL